jgi:lipopolysaccharide/colanic/teichoic acid biosynthesis glycosyltransferase
MRKLPFLILSIILSTLSSIKIKRNFKKFYKNQNNLYFYGSLSEYKNLNKILENKNTELSYNIQLINSESKLENDFNGILFSKKIINDSDYKYLINQSSRLKVNLYLLDDWLETNLNRIPNEYINFEKFIKKFNSIKQNTFHNRLKRFGDIFFSISLLFLSLPILLISGLLIWLNDRGSIIYKQKRVGKGGKEFYIYKLRTMILNAEKNSGPRWVSVNDRRITFIGKLLRKTRIDEIPQLICILNGDMSLIGPRPERPELELDLKTNIDNYELRYLVKPGLSGWAQVNANYAASIEGVKLKLSYDLYYIFNQSIFIDFLIFIKTIKVVFTAKGSDPIY